MRNNKIWVVEILFEDQPQMGWQTTVGAKLTRDEARDEEMRWLRNNGGIKTRVRKYAAMKEEK